MSNTFKRSLLSIATAVILATPLMATDGYLQQGLEGRHRLLAPIMAKDEFIKISLELIAPYAVMGSEQPLLQVADGAVCQRHHGLLAFVPVRSRGLVTNTRKV